MMIAGFSAEIPHNTSTGCDYDEDTDDASDDDDDDSDDYDDDADIFTRMLMVLSIIPS